MNQQEILLALPSREEDAKSMKEIALEMGLEISSYTKWIRVERNLCRVLRKLIKWDEVACARRQNTGGHKFWYTVYWKTRQPQQEGLVELEIEA